VPLGFALDFDSSAIIADHSYAIIAEIADGSGRLWFRNFEPYAVNPLAPAAPVSVVVTFVGRITSPLAPQSSSEEPQPVAPHPAILDTTWTATSIGGTPLPPRAKVSLQIGSADMRAGGRGGCNSYFAEAKVDGPNIAFGNVASTKMSCGPDANQLEEAFFTALRSAASWIVEGSTLTLFDPAGKPLVTFTH
jgi:putative lipoprotein